MAHQLGRVQIACDLCRKRKKKCDEFVPCRGCTQLGYHCVRRQTSQLIHSESLSRNTQKVCEELMSDDELLQYFVFNIIPAAFPMLNTSHCKIGWEEYVIPDAQSDDCYLHFCLSIAAQHCMTTVTAKYYQCDSDIWRRRDKSIYTFREALQQGINISDSLKTALAIIHFQRVVRPLKGSLSNIPWYEHLKVVVSLAQQLELPGLAPKSRNETDLSATLTAWTDILGSAIQGTAPQFASVYREMERSASSLGIQELTGCEDSVMFLVSEIACLEFERDRNGMEESKLCERIIDLTKRIVHTRLPSGGCKYLELADLSIYVTAAFRYAAHIYLHSLKPEFDCNSKECVNLVSDLINVLRHIPGGFDRSLVWVYLICGSASITSSHFRVFFKSRLSRLGDQLSLGGLGSLWGLLCEVWRRVDTQDEELYVGWREVMAEKGWDFCMI